MNNQIRCIHPSEYLLLNDFLYEAIFVPEGSTPPAKTITALPELQVYVKDFGKSSDDHGLVAEIDGKIVGAIWSRIMDDYGHLDNHTPSIAMAVNKPYRGLGIGTALLTKLLKLLRSNGYARVSLSVQKANDAVRLYQKAGFQVIRETHEEFIMTANL